MKTDLNLSNILMPRQEMYSPHTITISSPQPKPNPKWSKLWLHPMLCMKGSWVMWGQVAHRAAYDASATSESLKNTG